VALVGIDVSEELGASIIRVTKICELGTTLAVTRRENLKYYIFFLYGEATHHPYDGSAKLLRNVGSYKIHTP
jgi:hypothetical protein